MKLLSCLFASLLLAGCARDHFSSSVHSVAIKSGPNRKTVLLTPSSAKYFTSMAEARHGWVEQKLTDAVNAQLKTSGRFQPAKDAADGTVVFDAIRHGLVEVSSGLYAVTIDADITLLDRNSKIVGTRDAIATAGFIRPLMEFENPANYEEAITSAADKIALELVLGL